jgi:glycosyltransferase involved in cell wall biosynthesis
MKIVFLNDAVYQYASGAPVIGGAERQQWLLARALAAAGRQVVVGVRTSLEAGDRTEIAGVSFVGIGQGPILSSWYRFLKVERPDWWYWRCASHLWGPAVETAKLAGVRTVFAVGVDSDVHPRRALYRRANWWWLYAWGLIRTDRILVQHGGQLADLRPGLSEKAHLVRSIAVDAPAFTPHAKREHTVAWVAMLRQPKRPDLLIEIARKTPSVQYVVCGGSTTFASPEGYGDRMTHAMRAEPNVRVLGAVAPAVARQIIADSALLLSTSDAEGFPNTFLEAWSSGTPVISLTHDPDRVIQRYGLGSTPGTVAAAASDIVSLLNAPERRDDISARARAYIHEHHHEGVIVSLFERALRGTDASAVVPVNRAVRSRSGQ